MPPPPIRAASSQLNATMSAVSFFVTAAISFFLTPYVIRRLGNSSYGVLLMASETYGYYGLLDFGIRSAVGYYVAKLLAENRPTEAEETVRSAFWTLTAIATVLLPITAAIAWVFPSFMRIDDLAATEVRLSVGVLLAVSALNLPGSVPDAVLAGARRFDLSYAVRIFTTVAGALGVVLVVWSGGGLFDVALAQAAASIASPFIQACCLRSLGFGLTLWPPRIYSPRLPDLFRYGGANLTANVAQMVMMQTDVLVLGRLAGAAAVSYFQIGRYLALHMLSLVTSALMTLAPSFTHRSSSGDEAGVRNLLLNSSRVLGGITSLVTAGVLVFGPSFIVLWTGPEYVRGGWWDRSDSVLMLMTVAMFCRCIPGPFAQFLIGTRQMRFFTALRVGEAAVNLAAAIAFARHFGIAGVALSKLCVSAVSQFGFLVPFGLRQAGISIPAYLRGVMLPCAVVGGATAVPAMLMRSAHAPDRWTVFFGEVAVAGAFGALALWTVAMTPEQRGSFLNATARRLALVRR